MHPRQPQCACRSTDKDGVQDEGVDLFQCAESGKRFRVPKPSTHRAPETRIACIDGHLSMTPAHHDEVVKRVRNPFVRRPRRSPGLSIVNESDREPICRSSMFSMLNGHAISCSQHRERVINDGIDEGFKGASLLDRCQ